MLTPTGKHRKTLAANVEHLFRIIQSIPSKKAEPFKRWMAEVAAQRLDQMVDPELAINQAIADWRRLGYSESWINNRVKIAKKGGSVAKAARDKLESQLGHSVISPAKAADYLPPVQDVEALPEDEDTEGGE